MSRQRRASDDAVLEEAFQAKTPQASLQMLTIVSRALREHLDALKRADSRENPTEWIDILSHLAPVLASHLSKTEDVSEVSLMWRQFSGVSEIGKLPETPKNIVQNIVASSQRLPSDLDSCVKAYRRYNRDGFELARRVLRAHGLGHLAGARPARFSIAWDKNASYYCAGTTRGDRHIRWAHQPVAHGLYAALVPELIFAHEYFSHLAPRNKRLSRMVTEKWLVEALILSLEDEFKDVFDPSWRKPVWRLLRSALLGTTSLTSPATELIKAGYYGIDELAMGLYFKSADSFWCLTRLILTAEDGPEVADDVDELLRALVPANKRALLLTRKWLKISDLLHIIRTYD